MGNGAYHLVALQTKPDVIMLQSAPSFLKVLPRDFWSISYNLPKKLFQIQPGRDFGRWAAPQTKPNIINQ
jgi:hypothetical protein